MDNTDLLLQLRLCVGQGSVGFRKVALEAGQVTPSKVDLLLKVRQVVRRRDVAVTQHAISSFDQWCQCCADPLSKHLTV